MLPPGFWTEARKDLVRIHAAHTPDAELARILRQATGRPVTARSVQLVRLQLGIRR